MIKAMRRQFWNPRVSSSALQLPLLQNFQQFGNPPAFALKSYCLNLGMNAIRIRSGTVNKAMEAVATAQDDEERRGLREIYQRERSKLTALDEQLRRGKPSTAIATNEIVEQALEEFKNLTRKLDDANDFAETSRLLRAMNVRVHLKFKKVMWGKRAVNKLESGVVCVGSAPDPIIGGLTEADSLCKVNRGDRTPIELFERGTSTLEAGVQRMIEST